MDTSWGVYFRKSNLLLFAGLSLAQTKIRPKYSEVVVWAQNKGHISTQHPLRPLHRLLFWHIHKFKFFDFSILWSYLPSLGDNSQLVASCGCQYTPLDTSYLNKIKTCWIGTGYINTAIQRMPWASFREYTWAHPLPVIDPQYDMTNLKPWVMSATCLLYVYYPRNGLFSTCPAFNS